MASTTKTGPAGVAPAAAAATSAQDAPPAAQPSPVGSIAVSRPGSGRLGRAGGRPRASAAQLAQAAGITRTATARELTWHTTAGRGIRPEPPAAPARAVRLAGPRMDLWLTRQGLRADSRPRSSRISGHQDGHHGA
jgi:hypothetical protein